MKKITPPEHTKSDANCLFQGEAGDCCNALNYLRPHKCNGYCVAKLDAWLRKEHPEMDESTLLETVAELSGHSKLK